MTTNHHAIAHDALELILGRVQAAHGAPLDLMSVIQIVAASAAVMIAPNRVSEACDHLAVDIKAFACNMAFAALPAAGHA